MRTSCVKLLVIWPWLFLLLLPALASGETAVQAWVQRYTAPGNSDEEARDVTVDGDNNVIVTGRSGNNEGAGDYVTIKYSSEGVPAWTNRYDGPGNSDDQVCAVAVDGSNNVIVTGDSMGIGTGYDYATIKYSREGVALWTNRYSGPSTDTDAALAVAVDGSNNVVVTGYSTGSGRIYGYTTIKYSSEGVPLWTNRYNGPANSSDSAIAMAVDGSNNVIVTGESARTSVRPYLYDYATIKYSSEGAPLWTNCYNAGGANSAQASAVVVDSSNNVVVTGSGYATLKYSEAGVPLWTNRYTTPSGLFDYAYALAVDSSDNVVVTGSSLGSSQSSYGYATIQYSPAGVPLWTNRYDGAGAGEDYARDLVVDHSDNVIVTGRSTANEVDPEGLDYATIKYSSAGAPLWTNCYNGSGNGNDLSRAVAVDGGGNVIVTGQSRGAGSGDDFATIKYAFPLLITEIRLTDSTCEMLVDNLRPGPLVIEASTNLSGWEGVFTNSAPTDPLFFADPEAGNYPGRFYRAAQPR